jgi:L-glutamine-phosphate cytidylyltransferase
MTDTQPKCYVNVAGKRIVDWTLDAFHKAGLTKPVFIGGYQIDQIRRDYPHLTFCHNADWINNNILASLMHAESHMDQGFVCAYSDILFRDTLVRRALNHPGDIVLCVDTRWRDRYTDRSQHPEADAEKLIAQGDRVLQLHRGLPGDQATGEYIGVAKFSPAGAKLFREHYHRIKRDFAGKPWREAKLFEKSYLILLLQEMIEQGVSIHQVATSGHYFEIDTEEDYNLANRDWPKKVAMQEE